MRDLSLDRVAIVGPGRLGTALSYKFARDGKEVALYYHNADFCRELNETRLNPSHLTKDLVRLSGTLEKVPRLPKNVHATNDLEKIVEENDTVVLSVTMQRLPDVLQHEILQRLQVETVLAARPGPPVSPVVRRCDAVDTG